MPNIWINCPQCHRKLLWVPGATMKKNPSGDGFVVVDERCGLNVK